MRGNNVLGIIFSNVHDDKIRELTEKRTMGSVPFGGRYCKMGNYLQAKEKLSVAYGSSRFG